MTTPARAARRSLDPDQPAPLVFVFHGMTMSGQSMYDITQYATVAEREHFIVAFPDGEPASVGPWNVGANVCFPGNLVDAQGDDMAFLETMIEDIQSDACVDRQHTFVTGFSMGGFFAHDVGCFRPDIAALGAHSGGTHPFDACAVDRRPIIMFHGTADTTIPQSCDDSARAQWVQRNGCASTVVSKPVNGGHCEWSQGCPRGGQVVYCLFDGMGHAWAGGAPNMIASDPNYESATELSWSFFKNYAF